MTHFPGFDARDFFMLKTLRRVDLFSGLAKAVCKSSVKVPAENS